jgi:hypothetical protein
MSAPNNQPGCWDDLSIALPIFEGAEEQDVVGGGFRREVQPVDSIGSSTESRVSHSKRRLLLGFEGTKTARRERKSSTFSDARGCTSRRNSRGSLLRKRLQKQPPGTY